MDNMRQTVALPQEFQLQARSEGLMLAGMLLAKRTVSGKFVLDERVIALLAAASTKPLSDITVGYIKRAGELFADVSGEELETAAYPFSRPRKTFRGNNFPAIAKVTMLLALCGYECEDDPRPLLAKAFDELTKGISPGELMKRLSKDAEDDDEEGSDGDETNEDDGQNDNDSSGFDTAHPRWPAGSPGGIGGEFAPKDAGDATGTLIGDALLSSPASLKAISVVPPTVSSDGSLNSLIQWQLSSPSQKGGLIVQEIKGNVSETLQDGNVNNQTIHFWEAWSVDPGEDMTTLNAKGDAYDDHIGGKAQPMGSTGTITIDASARFYEGISLSNLNGFIPNNPDTIAHDLPSSTADPKLPTDNATPPVNRHYSVSW